jgi:methylenetetrahydrofolate reductase (NADH)
VSEDSIPCGSLVEGAAALRVPELYTQSTPVISFEFFPPKSAEAEEALFRDTVPALKELGAAFISVTYGAGGGTREQTLRIVNRIRRQFGVEAVAHVTCVGSTRATISSLLDEAHGLGIRNLLALRGDPPRGQSGFQAVPGGFRYAADLIAYVKSRNAFSIGAAAYPEGHIECPDKYLDWDRAAAKVAAGAELLITQLFYDVRDFFEFRDYLQNKRGVKVPIIPGILPFINADQIKRFTSLCGAKIPEEIQRQLQLLRGDDDSVRRYGVEVATEICSRLLSAGVPGIHFYCLNRVLSCKEILHNLRLAQFRETS